MYSCYSTHAINACIRENVYGVGRQGGADNLQNNPRIENMRDCFAVLLHLSLLQLNTGCNLVDHKCCSLRETITYPCFTDRNPKKQFFPRSHGICNRVGKNLSRCTKEFYFSGVVV